MDNTNTDKNALDSFHFSCISDDEVAVIRQAENQLNQNKQDKVVLIAYDVKNC